MGLFHYQVTFERVETEYKHFQISVKRNRFEVIGGGEDRRENINEHSDLINMQFCGGREVEMINRAMQTLKNYTREFYT